MGLAVNPTTPILMLVAPEQVPMVTAPLPDPRREFEPMNDHEAALREGLVRADGQLILDTMVTASVIVLNDGMEFDGVPTVVVFTSQRLCDEYLAQTGLAVTTLSLDMVEVLNKWPGDNFQLAVNPGSPVAFVLDSSRIPGMRGYAGDLIRELGGGRGGPPHPASDRQNRGSTTWAAGVVAPSSGPTHEHHRKPDQGVDVDDDSPVILPSDRNITDLLCGWD